MNDREPAMSFDELVAQAFEPAREAELTDREFAAAAARARRRWWQRFRRGPALIAVAAALVVGGGAVAGLFDRDEQIDQQVRQRGPFTSSGDPALDRLIAAARTRPGLAPLAATFTLEARAPDPVGGRDWVQVVWRTKTAGWCSYPGRAMGDEIKATRPDGGLGGFPFEEGGSCSDRPLTADGALVLARTYAGGPTVVHGVAGKSVAAVRVPGIPGVGELAPTGRGGFMAVVPQEIRSPSLRAELVLRDGTVRTVGG